MAETSGFFQAQWDNNLVNPQTGEETGWWDKNYIAKQFADYFALFIGNGVFGSPTNQLKVIPGTGLSVIVSPGWAFINGSWYHNDSNKQINLALNGQSSSRVDSIRIRYDDLNRSITALAFAGDTNVVRGDTVYDLKIAEVIVAPNAVSISASQITDTRTNENVCGLVKGLMEVETTSDLFAQYQSQFNEWFNSIKNQLVGDLAVKLQLEFTELNNNVDDYYENTEQQIRNYKNDMNTKVEGYNTSASQQMSSFKTSVEQTISQYQQNTSNQISGYNTSYQQTLSAAQTAAQTAQNQVTDYVDKDYVIAEQAFTFTNKVCTINDSKVTANSLIDVYFTAATIGIAAKAGIVVDSSAGKITMTADRQPTGTIRGMIRVRVR